MHESLAPLNLTQRRTFRAVFLNTTSLKAIPPSECSHGTSLYLSYMVDVHSALSAASGAIRREGISYIRAITTLVRRSLAHLFSGHRGRPFHLALVAWISHGFRRRLAESAQFHSELGSFAAQSFASSHSLHYICIRGKSPSPPLPSNARRSRTSAMCTPVANLISPSEYAKCAHDFLWKESRGFSTNPMDFLVSRCATLTHHIIHMT